MNASPPKGLFVTGSPRSGTSWVGRMLSLGPGTTYLHEPLNKRFTVETFKEEPFPYQFMYLNKQNESQYLERINRMIGLSPGADSKSTPESIPVIKDPIAVFSSEWFAHTYDLDVVFMIRHPGAFIKSILMLGWNTDPMAFLKQRPLMNELLSDYEPELWKYQNLDNKLVQAALMWKMIYHVGHIFQERNPDWIFVRHEDLSNNPNEGFKKIYSQIGLEYTDVQAKEIASYSSSENPIHPRNHWDIKRDSKKAVNNWFDFFTKDQIDEIRDLVEPVSSIYYQDNEWPC